MPRKKIEKKMDAKVREMHVTILPDYYYRVEIEMNSSVSVDDLVKFCNQFKDLLKELDKYG